MKKATILLFVAIGLSACKKAQPQENQSDTSTVSIIDTTKTESPVEESFVETNFDIIGKYEGVFPAASCPGIEKKLTLNADSTFVMSDVYIDRGDGKAFIDKGTFTIENNCLRLTIENSPSLYFIGDGFLEQLDMNGNKIEDGLNYTLTKK